MEGFFGISRAEKNQGKVLVIGGAAGSQHFLDSRPDVAPDFLPYLPRGSAQSPRILWSPSVGRYASLQDERRPVPRPSTSRTGNRA